ncbi:MAG: hypothetical protein LBK46_00330, partial [Oscillospiraceae bacterium]|nr:hypothetical protein [Oscillospiraceae bacterium]
MRRVCAAALAVLIASAVLTAGGCAVGEGFDGLPDGSTADEAGVSIHMAITNALKGGVDQTQTSLGLARFKTQADILGVDLLLDLGDLYYGNPFATMTGGESLADVIREVGYDAMLCGWSDWGYGVEKLRALERRSMVPVLASNVVSAETGEAFFGTPFIIRDIDGVRVGIFGVIDQALNRWTSKAVYEQVRFRDPVLAAQRAVSELAERGCQVIICMSSVSCAELIARSVPGLDAVLAGGEDWTGLDYGEDDVLRDVPIITAQTGLEDFASLELTMDPERLHVERVETRWYSAADYADIVPDPAVDSAIASRMTVLTPLFGEILNVTPVTLRAMDPMDPYAEAELPRLVTDAYREKTGADAAFTFAAATLKDIPAGSITYGQLIEL